MLKKKRRFEGVVFFIGLFFGAFSLYRSDTKSIEPVPAFQAVAFCMRYSAFLLVASSNMNGSNLPASKLEVLARLNKTKLAAYPKVTACIELLLWMVHIEKSIHKREKTSLSGHDMVEALIYACSIYLSVARIFQLNQMIGRIYYYLRFVFPFVLIIFRPEYMDGSRLPYHV